VRVNVESPEALSSIVLPKIALGSYIVDAAKLKTRDQVGVTLGMKNVFGLLPEKSKFMYHFRSIQKVIVDVNSVIKPDLTVIGGFVAMGGLGPVHGNPVKMDLIMAGRDPVATDAVAAKIMGFDPHSIYRIKKAAEKGIGEMEGIEVLGEAIEGVKRQFER